jgi:hypothetical protein
MCVVFRGFAIEVEKAAGSVNHRQGRDRGLAEEDERLEDRI